MKRIECKTHPKQPITNFCKHAQCYLPLCPECVVLHTAYHRDRQWHGEFDTIENTLLFCDSKLEEFEQNYHNFESVLYEKLANTKKEEENFGEKLDKIRISLIKTINNLCDNLKKDVDNMYKGFIEGMNQDLELMMREMKRKQQEMTKMRKNLEIYPAKTVIELYSTGFVIDHFNFQAQVSAFNQHLEEQIVSIEVNPNSLKEIEGILRENLVKFVRKNLKFEESSFKQRALLSPEPNIPRLRTNFDGFPRTFNGNFEQCRSPMNYGRNNNFGNRSPLRSPPIYERGFNF